MALTYTGKLFRRIAICCGAWTGNPHKIFQSSLVWKYRDEYWTEDEFIHLRNEEGKWVARMFPSDDKEFNLWKALRWLRDEGYITLTDDWSTHGKGHCRFSIDETAIRLTDKGMAAAPAYMKQKED